MRALNDLLPGEDLFGLLGRSLVMGIHRDYLAMRVELGLSHYKHVPGLLLSRDFSKIANILDKKVETLHAEHTCHNMLKCSVDSEKLSKQYTVSLHKVGDYISQPWRWCSECASEDIGNYGITYYRRDHQVPGVKSCSEHDCSLVLAECHRCGFKASSLKNMPIPPIDGRCPDCGELFGPDMSLFTPTMRTIETMCLDMVYGKLHINHRDLAKRVQRYLRISQEDIELDSARPQVRRFYRDVIDFYDVEELQEYFMTGAERKSGIYCPALQAGHVYDTASQGKPLHPLAMALVWHFLNENDSTLLVA